MFVYGIAVLDGMQTFQEQGVIAYYLRSLPQARRSLGECRDLLFRRGA